MTDLYRTEIIEAYRQPSYRGKLPHPDITKTLSNHSCGDKITVYITQEGTRIKEIVYNGSLCAIASYGAELMSSHLASRDLQDIHSINPYQLIDTNSFPIDKNPIRSRCFLLMHNALMAPSRDSK